MILLARHSPPAVELDRVLAAPEETRPTPPRSFDQAIPGGALLRTARWLDELRTRPSVAGSRPTPPWLTSGEVVLTDFRAASTDGSDLARRVMAARSVWSARAHESIPESTLMIVLAEAAAYPAGPMPARTTASLLNEGVFLGAPGPEARRLGVPACGLAPDGPTPCLVLRRLAPGDLPFLIETEMWRREYVERFGSRVPDAVLATLALTPTALPASSALALLDFLREGEAAGTTGIDPVTGLPGTTRLLEELADLGSGPTGLLPGTAVATVQVVNAGDLVREQGHRLFEWILFRLAWSLSRGPDSGGWQAARTGYAELTLWQPGVPRRGASDARASLEARVRRFGAGVNGEIGWTPRFGVGARAPGRGRVGPRSGYHARAAERARELYHRALIAADGQESGREMPLVR